MSIDLVDKIFHRFPEQFSRDYFSRFTELLNDLLINNRLSIERTISSLVSSLNVSNPTWFEYQLRLIRYGLEKNLNLTKFNEKTFFNDLFRHELLSKSSTLRYLVLQIGILIYETDHLKINDQIELKEILERFSSDSNLYVQKSLAEFLALFIIEDDYRSCFELIKTESNDKDLLYRILILTNENFQKKIIEQFEIYKNLSDTIVQRNFLLKTSKFLDDENPIVDFLNEILGKSLSDFVHHLLSVIDSRFNENRSIRKLLACLKAVFLLMKQIEIEQIDEIDQQTEKNDENFLIELISSRIFQENYSSTEIGLIVFNQLEIYQGKNPSWIDQLEIYSSTVDLMLIREITDEKLYSQLIRSRRNKSNEIDRMIFYRVMQKIRSPIIYRSFFHWIFNVNDPNIFIEQIEKLIEKLLFDEEKLFQWEQKDSAFQFLIDLVKNLSNSTLLKFPSWFKKSFLEDLMENFVFHNNEYVQADLVVLFMNLVDFHFLSPFDGFLISNLIKLTEISLGDIVRCALARCWSKIFQKSKIQRNEFSFRFSFQPDVLNSSLTTTIIGQIPRLIGDGGQQTELECFHLIQMIDVKNSLLDEILDFLVHGGSNDEIKRKARRYIGKTDEILSNQLIDEELCSILHWLENPDEHLTLDCD